MRLMSGGAAAAAAAPAATGTPGQATAAAAASPAAPTDTPFMGAVRIMPIERLNSVLVVTPRAAYLEEARAWIERLDQPNANSTEPQLFIYPVQNGSARHLASVISGLFGAGGTTAASPATGVAPALGVATAGTPSAGVAGVAANSPFGGTTARVGMAAGANTTANRNTTSAGVTAVALSPTVRMIADEINNAVLFYGTRADFVKIEPALKRLDISPIQVLIEASIIEVTLSDDLEYGLQWLFSGGAPGKLNGNGAISSLAGGALGAAKAGFSYTLTNSAGNIRAVLNALAGKSLVKVISSPSVMVLDNHTASITVGNQQPVKTATTVASAGTTTESIQYKDAGVSLTVTPSVTAGNMVTMDMNQTVTDVGNIDVATGQRAFLQRQINSKVAVRSGESLVLGGLIRDNNTSGSSGLPLLSSLPLVGGLFGTQSSNSARTELLVVLMPRVLRADQDLREISQELRDRMKGLGQGMQVPAPLALPR
jgi:general secretion pathway protein D